MAHIIVLTSTGLIVLLLALASNFAIASAAPSPEVSLDFLLPHPNTTGGPAGEIKCYALPYGAMGIVSHLLTYWAMAWVGWGRAPLWPRRLIHNWQFDLLLGVSTLVTCIPIATITIYRCRLSWHFVLISVWKLVTSVSVALISIHRCMIIRRAKNEETKYQPLTELSDLQSGPQQTGVYLNGVYHTGIYQDGSYHNGTYQHNGFQNHQAPGSSQGARINQFSPEDPTKTQRKADLKPFFWLILFLAGTVVGMVGLGALLWENFRKDVTIKHLTIGFAAVVVIVPGMVAAYWYTEHCFGSSNGKDGIIRATRHTVHGALTAFLAVFGVFAALYSDLVLGIIAENILGTPSGDVTPLYWIWFVAKRFPMFSL